MSAEGGSLSQLCPVAMETSRRRWAAGEGGGSWRRDREEAAAGGREPASAALEPPFASECWRECRRTEPPAQAQALSRPPPRSRRRAADPSGPAWPSGGRAPPCPGLGAQTGPGRHLDGDSRNRLSGDRGQRVRSCLPTGGTRAASSWASGPGGAQPVPRGPCRSWVLPIRRTVPVTPPLCARPATGPLPEKCPFLAEGPRHQSFQEPVAASRLRLEVGWG